MANPLRAVRRAADRLRRRYSVLVLAGPDEGLRQFHVPGLAVPLAAGVVGLGLVGGGAAVLDWADARVERSALASLRVENERLAAQLVEIREAVEVFENRMAENLELEQSYRNLANLEAIPEDVRLLGVGGPPPFSELADEASPSVLVREARETLNRLDDLNRQAQFQSANFREMMDSLRETRQELAHVPSISPVEEGFFSSGYGLRRDPFTGRTAMHRGADFSAWTGTPVRATADGLVTKASQQGELGLMIEIDHGNGVATRYGHNSRLLVKVGERVKRGDRIAHVGSTGRSTSPHCHYEVRVDGNPVNPWRYILDGGPRRVESGA